MSGLLRRRFNAFYAEREKYSRREGLTGAQDGRSDHAEAKACYVLKCCKRIPDRGRASRQVPLATEPQAFLGFELGHLEQKIEHVELVPSRQRSQFRGRLGNEGCGLVRPAIARWAVASRTPAPALVRASSPATGLDQNNIQCRESLIDTPFKCATIGSKSQLFR